MIQLQSKLKIIDNSGGSVGRCIRILKPHGRKLASVGDVVLISIIEVTKKASLSAHTYTKKSNTAGPKKDTVTKGSIKRGTISKALVVRTKSHGYKNAATFPDGNAVVLLKSNSSNPHSGKNLGLAPVGSRIKGPVSSVLKLTPSSPIYPSFNIPSFLSPYYTQRAETGKINEGGVGFASQTPVVPNLDSLYSQEIYKTIMAAVNPELNLSAKDIKDLPQQVKLTKGQDEETTKNLPLQEIQTKNVKLGEAAIQYLKVLALSKLHY